MISLQQAYDAAKLARREAADFDLRPQRDICSRRVWRERFRKVVRVTSLVGGETVAAGVALLATLVLADGPQRALVKWPALYPLFLTLSLGAQAVLGTYGANRARRSYVRSFLGSPIVVAALFLLGLVYPLFRLTGTEYLLLAVLTGLAFMGVRLLIDRAIIAVYRKGMGRKPTLIIGEHEAAWDILIHLIASKERRSEVIGHLAPDPSKDPTALGGLEMLRDLIEKHDIRRVIVSAHLSPEHFQAVVRRCLLHGASVSVVPGTLSELPCKIGHNDLMGWPLLELQVPRLHLLQVALKRTVDILGSLAGIVLLLPVGLVIAAAIRRDSRGPIFFRQERLGLAGRRFRIFKFRSMLPDAEDRLRRDPELYRRYVDNDFKLPPEEDPRVTRVGCYLRRTSLDELPQLLNVLKGDMSLVGPRPIVPGEIDHYGEEARVFLAVKPGLTGHWQTNGRSEVGYPERAKLDIDYITHWTLGMDLRILAQTLPAVLRRNGAH
ncbi:MAG: sugar transferase [Gemmatimonadota bacterium]